MNKPERVVIQLVRKALNKETEIDPNIFKDVPWADVINLSMAHGIGAIAFDGVESLPAESRPNMGNLLDWLGQVAYQEELYEYNWTVANQLAELWGKEGISAIVLKGRSIAQYYPKPEHRYSCDLDVFIHPTSSGQVSNGWDDACKVLAEKGVKLSYEVYKEVEFSYHDVYVECHRYITPCRGNRTLLKFETFLRSVLNGEERTGLDNSKLGCPPLLFTIMLYIEHALGDFLHGKLSLKHVVDWMVLRKQKIDWSAFDRRCKDFKFVRFVALINAVADVVEGEKELSSLPQNYQDAFNEMFIPSDEMHKSQSWFKRRVGLFFVYLKNKKKFDQFGYCSMYKLLFCSMWTHFFDKEVNMKSL